MSSTPDGLDAAPSLAARAIARLRARLGGTTWLFLLAICVGAAAGGGAILLHDAIVAFQWVFFGTSDPGGPVRHLATSGPLGSARALLAPALGGLLVGLLSRAIFREGLEPGVPGVLRAIQERGGRMSLREAIGTALASAVSLGSGLSLGREGPVVHLGASIASGLGRFGVTSSRELRVLAACGAGAGLGAVFDAPLGGAAFALEVVVGSFALEACGPVLVATVAGTALARSLREAPVVTVPAYQLGHPSELAAYVVLGLLAGLLAAGLIRAIGATVRRVDALPLPGWLKPALGGLFVGLVAVGVTPRVLGNGYETIDLLLRGRALETSLLLLLAVKVATTSVSMGAGGVGGLFGPSIFLGAVLGGAVGTLVHAVSPGTQVGAFALVGMAAVVAGTTHAPVCMVLMLFELTDDYGVVLPLLVSAPVASTLARRLCRESIDTIVGSVRGRAFGVAPGALDVVRLADVMRPAPEALVAPSASMAEVLQTFLRARSDIVVVGDPRVLGTILLEDVHSAVSSSGAAGRHVVAHDVMREDLPRLMAGDTLARALEVFQQVPCGALPVVDAAGALVGLIDDRPLVSALQAERLRADLVGVAPGDVGVDLGPDATLARVPTPAWLAGRSLADVDLRRRTGVQVVALRSAGAAGATTRIPDPRALVPADAILVLVGPAAAIDALRRGEVPAGAEPAPSPATVAGATTEETAPGSV